MLHAFPYSNTSMIGLIAAKTVDSLGIGKNDPAKINHTDTTDSDSEIFNLLPKNRMVKKNTHQVVRNADHIALGPKCRAFVAFLVMVSFVGVVMLVCMAAFGEFKPEDKLTNFYPVTQIKPLKADEVRQIETSIESIRGYRLHRSVFPQKYNLKLNVKLEKARYAGTVSIRVLCEKETDRIVLHSAKHDVQNVWVKAPKYEENVAKDINVTRIGKDLNNEFLILHLSGKLQKGIGYELGIEFKGFITDEAKGFYIADSNKRKKSSLALTNFEPIYARRMFPCFDEPEMRAKFQLTVTHDAQMKVTTYMPLVKSVIVKKGLVEDRFQQTPPMPPYLLSLMVTKDLTKELSYTKKAALFETFAQSDDKILRKLAKKTIETGMVAFEKAFKMKYPLSKLETAILPESVEGGGLGFILLPQIDVTSSPSEKFRFMEIASKKLGRTWLDGLVGIKQWTDYWLFSGLSILISHNEVLRKLQPRLNMHHLFYMMYMQPALKRDQNEMAALSLSGKLESNHDIERRLGGCYEVKAASILHMISSFTGKNPFMKGIQNFVRMPQNYGSSVEGFTSALSKVSKTIKVLGAMKDWINRPAYPVVHLNYDSKRRRIFVSQTSITANMTSDKSIFWKFPLRLRISSGKKVKRVMLERGKASFHVATRFQWLKANYGQAGFYRVTYSHGLWNGLIKTLAKNHTIVPEVDRAGLIDDAFSLAKLGQFSFKSALAVTPYLKKEQSFLVWKISVQHFKHIIKIFQGHKHSFCVKKYLFRLIQHMVDNIGWSNNGNLIRRELRPEIFEFSALIGDKKTIKESKKMFKKIISSGNDYNIPWSLRALIVTTAVRNGGEKEWKLVMKLYKMSKKNADLALVAAAASKSASNIESFLQHIFLNSKTPLAEMLTILKELSSKPDMTQATWKLVMKYWNALVVRKEERQKFTAIIKNLIETTTNKEDLINAKRFTLIQVQKDIKSLVMAALTRHFEELKELNRQRQDIVEWIEKISGKACL